MRVAIYGRLLEAGNVPYVQKLFDELKKRGIQITVYKKFIPHLDGKIDFDQSSPIFGSHQDIAGQVDFLLSVGGDGTLLDTLVLVQDSNIPVMGINTGRLGFLSSIGRDEIVRALDALEDQSYIVDKKDLLRLESNKSLFPNANFALNEFTIHKVDTASMIVVHTFINGDFVNSYWADGLIVATPTGSTAYSLSCGGPVILPDSRTFVITPVAPHHLNVRPIIVPDDAELTFILEGRQDSFTCSLDSRHEIIDSSYEITIRKEAFSLNLVRLHEADFLTTLRNKLYWGFDKRNN